MERLRHSTCFALCVQHTLCRVLCFGAHGESAESGCGGMSSRDESGRIEVASSWGLISISCGIWYHFVFRNRSGNTSYSILVGLINPYFVHFIHYILSLHSRCGVGGEGGGRRIIGVVVGIIIVGVVKSRWTSIKCRVPEYSWNTRRRSKHTQTDWYWRLNDSSSSPSPINRFPEHCWNRQHHRTPRGYHKHRSALVLHAYSIMIRCGDLIKG